MFIRPTSPPFPLHPILMFFLFFSSFFIFEKLTPPKTLLRTRSSYNNKRRPPILNSKIDSLLFYLAQSTAAWTSLSEWVGVASVFIDWTSTGASRSKLNSVSFRFYPNEFAIFWTCRLCLWLVGRQLKGNAIVLLLFTEYNWRHSKIGTVAASVS